MKPSPSPAFFPSPLSFFGKLFRLQIWSLLLIFVLSLVWSLDSTLWPYILRLIIDTLTEYDADRSKVWEALKWPAVAGICLWIAVECGFRARDFIKAYAFPRLEANIRTAMFDHIQYHSPKYFNEHFAGSLANKITDMTTQIISMLQNMTVFIPAFASCILILTFFSAINPLFAAILAVWIVLHFSACFFFTKKCIRYSDIHARSRSKLIGKIVDSFTNNFAVNLFFRFRFEKLCIENDQKIELEKNRRAHVYIAYMLLTLSCIFLVGIITLNTFLILYWMQNKISLGEVVQVFNTTFNVIMILWFAGDLLPQFFRSAGIVSQAFSVMRDPKDVTDLPGTPELRVDRGEIVFEKVSFRHGQKELFTDKDVRIKGGEKVGLVGYSGAGKTSFIGLILRLYPIDGGKILIDGQNIAEVTLESVRKNVTLIPQDPLLFHRTLEENIRYGNLDASPEEIMRASEFAHCDAFIKKCPEGYASLVGERGTKLSGGERQRIAIARALLSSAPILIMDEATSALDSVTEQYIQESLESLMQNRTILVIAHRLSTLAKMDRILVFDRGKIIEEGSHDELLKKRGHYANMWNMQAGGFLPDAPASE